MRGDIMYKKIFLTVVVVCLILTLSFYGCNGAEEVTDEEVTAEETTAEEVTEEEVTEEEVTEEDPNETGTLNLIWFAGVGNTDLFECTYMDKQAQWPAMVFDSLVKIDVDEKTIIPRLATSWDVSSDGLTYTFTLAENVKWHDGTVFSADDVAFSFNTDLTYPKGYSKNQFINIKGASDIIDGNAETASGVTVNGNVVSIELIKPDNLFIYWVPFLDILPKHLLEDADIMLFENDDFWKKPIGTGAYYVDKVSFPDYFTLVRNDDYFRENANIKNITFTSYVVGGVESIAAALIAGDIDFGMGQTVNDISSATNAINNNPEMKIVVAAGTYTRALWMNVGGDSEDGKYNTDLLKPEVRRAIELAIDKEALASFYEGVSAISTTFLHPSHHMYNSDIPPFERDVEKANEMLVDAGFDFDRPIRLSYYYTDETAKDIIEVLSSNLREAGIEVESFLLTGDVTYTAYEAKNVDIVYGADFAYDPLLMFQWISPDGGMMDETVLHTMDLQRWWWRGP